MSAFLLLFSKPLGYRLQYWQQPFLLPPEFCWHLCQTASMVRGPFDLDLLGLDVRGICLHHLDVLDTVVLHQAWSFLHLTRMDTSALCCSCSHQTLHPHLVDFKAAVVLAYFATCTLLGHYFCLLPGSVYSYLLTMKSCSLCVLWSSEWKRTF